MFMAGHADLSGTRDEMRRVSLTPVGLSLNPAPSFLGNAISFNESNV